MSRNQVLDQYQSEADAIGIAPVAHSVEPAASRSGAVTCFGGPRMTPSEAVWERMYRMSAEDGARLDHLLAAVADQHGPSGQ